MVVNSDGVINSVLGANIQIKLRFLSLNNWGFAILEVAQLSKSSLIVRRIEQIAEPRRHLNCSHARLQPTVAVGTSTAQSANDSKLTSSHAM